MRTEGLSAEQIKKLANIEHGRKCAWYDDEDWNSGTFASYVRAYGHYPDCTCDEGQNALNGS